MLYYPTKKSDFFFKELWFFYWTKLSFSPHHLDKSPMTSLEMILLQVTSQSTKWPEESALLDP